MLVKTSSGANIYYILRDHLGSITRIYKSDNTLLQERSYDAWGRMRNPSTQAVYAPGNEPSLYLGRGYTGHELSSMHTRTASFYITTIINNNTYYTIYMNIIR